MTRPAKLIVKRLQVLFVALLVATSISFWAATRGISFAGKIAGVLTIAGALTAFAMFFIPLADAMEQKRKAQENQNVGPSDD